MFNVGQHDKKLMEKNVIKNQWNTFFYDFQMIFNFYCFEDHSIKLELIFKMCFVDCENQQHFDELFSFNLNVLCVKNGGLKIFNETNNMQFYVHTEVTVGDSES